MSAGKSVRRERQANLPHCDDGETWQLLGGAAVAVVHRSPQEVRAVVSGLLTPFVWEELTRRLIAEKTERIELVIPRTAIMASCCRFAVEAVQRAMPARTGQCRFHVGVPLVRLAWAHEFCWKMTDKGHPMVPFLVPGEAAPTRKSRAGKPIRRSRQADLQRRVDRAERVLRDPGVTGSTREDWEAEAGLAAADLVIDRAMTGAAMERKAAQ